MCHDMMKEGVSQLKSDLSLTYAFSVIPEEWSFSSPTVTQGNDQS